MTVALLAPPPVDEGLLASLASVAEQRLGLAAHRWPTLALRRRLEDLMRAAAEVGESPAHFVQRLALADETSPLALAAADTLPNGETYFFRDQAQLEALVQRAVPRVTQGAESKELKVLCAGCSTGQEVYSLAILLHAALSAGAISRFKVWGLDVSPGALRHATTGWYSQREVQRGGPGLEAHRRYFREQGEALEVRPVVREACHFVRGNLLAKATLPEPASFDVVVCRNVLIHVSARHLPAMVDALVALVRPGGALVVGAAEAACLSRPDVQALAGEAVGLFLKPARGHG